MHINWSTIIWIGVVLFVYFFGIWEGRGQGYKRRKAEEEQEKKEQPEPTPSPATVTVDDPGLLRIKNENNALVLDLDGGRVDPSSLSPDQRKRLIEMINLMRPWLEGKPAVPAPSPVSQPAPAMTPTPSTPLTTRQPTPAAAPASSARISQPTPSVPAVKKEEKAEAVPTSMVGQINLILQARIANTKFMSQGISLMESPSGGVNVYVGINRYEGIDEVPDEEVKAIIRAAIAEWEKKYTPGLS